MKEISLTDSSRFSVSIITPVYNEEEIVVESIQKNIAALLKVEIDWEIIIVNDGSSDRSRELIEQNFSGKRNINLIHQRKNKGFGSAVRTGINASTKQYLLCIPADSPLDFETLSTFIAASSKADVVVSYRIERLGYSRWMKINSGVFHYIVSHLFSIQLRDFNWIHLYNRKVFDQGKVEIKAKGIFMLAEVLIKAKRKGFSFFEIPVHQTERLTGVATASKISSVIKTVQEIFVFYFAESRKRD